MTGQQQLRVCVGDCPGHRLNEHGVMWHNVKPYVPPPFDPVPSPTTPARDSGPVVCLECGWLIGGECSCYEPRPAPSSAPPARDSGRDEAREAVARWLWEAHMGYEMPDGVNPVTRLHYRDLADELLALPEVRRLLDGAR